MTSMALTKAGGKHEQPREAQRDASKASEIGSSRRSGKVEYRRRTIEFHPEIDEIIQKLQFELKLRNQTDVIQKAIQVLAILTGEGQEERPRVFITDKDGELLQLVIV